MTQEHIEDEIKDTGNFRESIHQMIVEIDELSTQINWKRPEIQISQFLSLILIRLLKVLASERENCRRLTLRNSKLIPFSFNPFWDSFASAVDDNPGLSDVDKLNYLRNLLVGPAAGAIRGLPLTAEIYESARAILKKRFEQPQVIINARIEGLEKVSAVSAYNHLRRLRLLYDRVEAHVRALQVLGINSESYGKLLIPLLMEKVPPNMRLRISRTVDQPEWDLDVLLDAFDHEIEARERCEPIGTNPTDPSTSKKPFSVPSRKS